MENRVDKNIISENFSKYARLYDDNNSVQDEAAGMLAKRLPSGDIADILEIGCGTGGYTRFLREKFGNSRIKAVDISGEMVRIAKEKLADDRMDFIIGDAEEIEFKEKFDFVTSNAAFHWFDNLEKMIEKSRGLLVNGGTLAFSIFGPKTFPELKKSIALTIGEDITLTSDLFHNKETIGIILRKHLKDVLITERFIGRTHTSLTELLKRIKYSGTRGLGAGMGRIWSPGLLGKVEKNYLEQFGAIEATYQVFFCEAIK